MSLDEKSPTPARRAGSGSPDADGVSGINPYAPRKLSFRENMILTIKVLAGGAVAGAVLWGMHLWTSSR